MSSRPLAVSLASPGLPFPDDGVAFFSFCGRTSVSPDDPRQIFVGLPPLANDAGTIEVWRSSTIDGQGERDGIGFVRTREVLFGHLLVEDDSEMEAAAADAYRRVLSFIAQSGFPHLLRTWNYFPHINATCNGTDRYQQFCIGRFRALTAIGYPENLLPAATAIGTATPGFLVFFIAAREAGEQVENPRQTSAFRYPQQYGPQSPSFSRATLKRWNGHNHLYISGTASIVGHASLHAGDTLTQLDEIIANLGAVIDSANTRASLSSDSPSSLDLLKVYLRRPDDLPDVRRHLREKLGDSIPVLYLHGDICRADLLVEIEGLRT